MADWKTIRIFISSTFRDMFAERDHLVRVVFPELKERCRKKRLHLIDIDLRWGVTEKDAQEGRALDICLDEIDSCRPYFLGLLGQRYGFIPDKHHHSITAQEIFHGVLHNDLPTQIIDLRSIIEGKLEGKRLSNEQANVLVHCYQRDAEKKKYLLKPDISSDEEGIIRSVFAQYSAYQRDRSFFFFRAEALTHKLAGERKEDFFDNDPELAEKLATLKKSILDEGLPCFEYDSIEAFGQNVLDTLWERIDAEVETAGEEKDWLREEAEFHELFVADRTRRFVGRKDVLDKMHAFCENPDGASLMVIRGEPGSGKSALMGRFSEGVMLNHADWLVIPHFVGASPGSTSLRQTLRRFCGLLSQSLGIVDEVPEDIKELLKLFPELLTKTAEQRMVLFILDAVNQLEKTDNAHNMYWLPQELPENVKFVLSTLAGDANDALMRRRNKPDVETIKGLLQPEIEEFVTGYLKEVKKEFPNPEVAKSFFDKVKTGNPLYIQVALEELRVFGQFEKVAERVNSLPDDIPALFDQVLQRIEGDFSPALVKDCMSYIACGRYGMTAEELQTLLKGHTPKTIQGSPLGRDVGVGDSPLEKGVEGVVNTDATKLPDMLWARLYRAFSAYLFERSGVIDFFHGQLKEAVGKRYLSEETERLNFHKIIADYFESRWREPYVRALDELPHQRIKARDVEGIDRVLTDLEFIEAKCKAEMTTDLASDYINSLALENEWKGRERIIEFHRFLLKESHVLRQYPELTFQQAMNQPDKTEPYRSADLLWRSGIRKNPWFKWVNKPQHIDPCIMTLEGHSTSVKSCAISPDGRTIVAASLDSLKLWDAKTGSEIKSLLEEDKGKTCCAYSPDGRRIVSASEDGTLKIWDAETGIEILTFKGHSKKVTACVFSPDGRRIVSASWDATLKIWDAQTCEEIFSLRGQSAVVSCVFSTDSKSIAAGFADKSFNILDAYSGIVILEFKGVNRVVTSCAFSPNNRMIVTASYTTLEIWDVETGTVVSTLKGHSETVTSCAFSLNGRMIISASGDKTLKVWDVETGIEICTLKGHSDRVTSCTFSPDGKKIISASSDKTLKIWGTPRSTVLHALTGHSEAVTSCAFSPDGKMIASTSWDGSLKIWDAESRAVLHTLHGHSSCAFSHDGKIIISALRDKSLIMWDVKSGKESHILKGHTGYVSSCAFSSDGKKIISACHQDKSLKIWDAESGVVIRTLIGHHEAVTSCTFSPDDKKIISASHDNTLRIWDAESGVVIRTLIGHDGAVTSCAFSPDGKTIVSISHDGSMRTWDTVTGATVLIITCADIQNIDGNEMNTLIDKLNSAGTTCSFSPDGKRIISASWNCALKLFNAVTGQEISTLKGHSDKVTSCAFSPDGRRIISASADKTLIIWDAEVEVELHKDAYHSDKVTSCAFAPNGRRIVSSSTDKYLKIWDAINCTNTRIIRFSDGLKYETYCNYAPDGRRIASGFSDILGFPLKICDAESGDEINSLVESSGIVSFCSFSPDGRRVVAISQDKIFKMWNVKKNTLIRNSKDINCCAYSPDNKMIVLVPSDYIDVQIKVCDALNGTEICTLKDKDYIVGSVNSCAFSPDGKMLVAGFSNGKLKLWDLSTGNVLISLWGHDHSSITFCTFSEDGKRIVSLSKNALKIWDVIEKLPIAEFIGSGNLTAATTLINMQLVVGDNNGNMYFLSLEGAKQYPPITTAAVYSVAKGRSRTERPDVVCTWCGDSFNPDKFVFDIINNYAAQLSANQSPCLTLPSEAWDDPRLLYECPHCQRPLRFNPFVVENMYRMSFPKKEIYEKTETDNIQIKGHALSSHEVTYLNNAKKYIDTVNKDRPNAVLCPKCGRGGAKVISKLKFFLYYFPLLAGSILLSFRSHWWLFLTVPVGLFSLVLLIWPFVRDTYQCQTCLEQWNVKRGK